MYNVSSMSSFAVVYFLFVGGLSVLFEIIICVL